LKNKQNSNLLNDTIWYFIGAAIPMTVLLIRSPIYTRIFSPADYGYYSLVNITFTYLTSLSFTWITSCAWRYYLQYKNTNNNKTYSQILSTLFLYSSIVLLMISGVWIIFTDNILLRKLIVFGFIFFSTNELINMMLVPIRIDGNSKLYNILHSTRAIISFCLLLSLTFIANIGIESFFLAGAIINLVYIGYIFIYKTFNFRINLKILFLKELKQYISYGTASLGINLCLYFLISSDRYILALYRDIGEVGVYNQIYNIAQVSLVAAINVYLAAINPKVFEKLESTDNDTNRLLSDFAYKTFFLFLPAALFMSILAKPISIILLGPKFQYAYFLLPFIVFGVLFNGMNNFETSKFKFRNKIHTILVGAIIATVLNIGLNFIFIPKFGIVAAAAITTISYIFLWLFYYFKSDLRYLSDSRFKKSYFLLFLISLIILSTYIYFERSGAIEHLSLLNYFLFSSALVFIYFIITIKINPFIKNTFVKYLFINKKNEI